jgi:hypothetical protein
MLLLHCLYVYTCLSAEDSAYTAFFQALCSANEELLAGGDEAGPALLKLAADVIFPGLLPGEQGQGMPPTVLVRKCWKEFRNLILQQRKTLGERVISSVVKSRSMVMCISGIASTPQESSLDPP